MSEMVKVVVDAMGGDNAPEEPVKAAVEAVKEKENIQVILTGVQDVIEAELDEKMDRWVYLNDLAEQIENQKE